MRWTALGLILAAAALGTQARTAGPDVVTAPDWLRKPSLDDLARFYPADPGGIGGRAKISCIVTARGTLDRCTVLSETPPGRGFGAAALALAPMFMMRPMAVNGEPVGGATVVVPINFGASSGFIQQRQTISLAHSLPWKTSPTAGELAAAFPSQAVGKSSYGHVVLQCHVSRKGTVENCDTASETPIGLGFARAARDLAKDFRVASDTPILKEVRDLYVEIPVDFRDQTKSSAPVQVYDAEWLQGPDPQMAGAIYPPEAVKAGVKTGVGEVECEVTHTGALSGCTVAREDPAGLGFGETALAVSKIMKMNPWSKQGFPVDGARIRVPIRFNLADMNPGATPASPAAKP
jgi:TonB family protein